MAMFYDGEKIVRCSNYELNYLFSHFKKETEFKFILKKYNKKGVFIEKFDLMPIKAHNKVCKHIIGNVYKDIVALIPKMKANRKVVFHLDDMVKKGVEEYFRGYNTSKKAIEEAFKWQIHIKN